MTSIAMDDSKELTISVYVKRDLHENGMTLKEYADGVLSGTHDVVNHDEFLYQFAATNNDMDLVAGWVFKNKLQLVSIDSGTATIKVTGTAGQFNQLFKITLLEVDDGTRVYTNHYGTVVIPAEIAPVVENVLGFDQSFVAKRNATQVPLNSSPPTVAPNVYVGAVTPPGVASAYRLPPGDGNGGCIGIFELTYSGYVTGWNQTDVNNSFNRINVTPPTIVNVALDGSSVSLTSDAESMMDIYCAGAVAPKAKIVYYDAPNGGTQYINDIINYAANDTVNNPEVLSISWGIGDNSYYDSAMQSCIVKGITVIVSSGDHGATGQDFDYASCSSPYAMLAGGTNTGISGGVLAGESGWTGSGGGQSYVQPLPGWQTGLTRTTKTSAGVLGTPTALTRRGIPDISAPADPYTGYQFYVNGSLQQWGGTSAAAPFLAGMIVRLNRLLGKRIGLPMSNWYSNPQAFNDITTGDNISGYAIGYTNTVGWDAVTGLGTPNGVEFQKLFRKGAMYPKNNNGFRTQGSVYPRPRGIR